MGGLLPADAYCVRVPLPAPSRCAVRLLGNEGLGRLCLGGSAGPRTGTPCHACREALPHALAHRATLPNAPRSGALPCWAVLAPLRSVLVSKGLRGSIPAAGYDLPSSVYQLDLKDNQIAGPLPSDWSWLPSRILDVFFDANSLTGSLVGWGKVRGQLQWPGAVRCSRGVVRWARSTGSAVIPMSACLAPALAMRLDGIPWGLRSAAHNAPTLGTCFAHTERTLLLPAAAGGV